MNCFSRIIFGVNFLAKIFFRDLRACSSVFQELFVHQYMYDLRQSITFHFLWGICISRPPALCLGPSPDPKFAFTGPGPQFVFTGPGTKFVFISPRPKFVFTGRGPQFVFTGSDP